MIYLPGGFAGSRRVVFIQEAEMPKFLLVLLLAFTIVPAAMPTGASQDLLDFGDPLPLPPPPIDDAAPAGSIPSPIPPALAIPPVTSAPDAPAVSSNLLPPPPAVDNVPAAPPAVPPIGGSGGQDSVSTIDLPDSVGSTPAQPAGGQTAQTPAVPEKPLPARINGGRVNVRAGPNTQYESIAVLTTGAPITVLSKHNDWYKIVFPADQLASIHKNFVTADITGEIPEAGVPGIVSQDNADVHAFYWDKSTVVGQLNKGDQVTIKQERGQWYRIAAPPTAKAFVFAEYVKVDGGEAVPVDTAQAPVNPSIDLNAGKEDATGRLRLSENDRKAAQLKEQYFTRLQEAHRKIEEEEVLQVNRLEEALDTLEQRLRAVDTETASQMAYPITTTTIGSAAWAPPDPLYGGFTGWVENIGRVGGFPSSHRLTKGGEVRFYLRSGRFNLDDFSGRRVWVNGNIDLATGAAANILNVEQIRVLSEAEIAEGMPVPQQATATTTTTTTTYGPTGVVTYSDPFDPFGAGSTTTTYSDPYATTSTTTTTTTWPDSQVVQYPASPESLPDHIGSGVVGSQSPYVGPIITGGPGEVMTDYYESPIISEVGP